MSRGEEVGDHEPFRALDLRQAEDIQSRGVARDHGLGLTDVAQLGKDLLLESWDLGNSLHDKIRVRSARRKIQGGTDAGKDRGNLVVEKPSRVDERDQAGFDQSHRPVQCLLIDIHECHGRAGHGKHLGYRAAHNAGADDERFLTRHVRHLRRSPGGREPAVDDDDRAGGRPI